MKINWSRALVDYLNDETVSYASLALKYGISIQSVKNRASKEGWQELRRKTIQKVDQLLPEKIGETIAEINARHARVGKELQIIGKESIDSEKVTPKTLTEARQMIVDGIRLERDALNLDKLSTDLSEIRITFGTANLTDKSLIKDCAEWAK